MQLPFTREQFFDLFAAYNAAVWPAVVVLWIASAAISVLLLSSRRLPDRWISALLAAHWIWSAVVYHAVFFTRINPAAWLFAALFAVQAALFFWAGVVQGRLSFARWRNAWAPVGWGLVAYSLVYPGINAVQHLTWSRIPAFGVPCPTTIFTAGLLMLAKGASWRLSIVPVIWSVIGGSPRSFSAYAPTTSFRVPVWRWRSSPSGDTAPAACARHTRRRTSESGRDGGNSRCSPVGRTPPAHAHSIPARAHSIVHGPAPSRPAP